MSLNIRLFILLFVIAYYNVWNLSLNFLAITYFLLMNGRGAVMLGTSSVCLGLVENVMFLG